MYVYILKLPHMVQSVQVRQKKKRLFFFTLSLCPNNPIRTLKIFLKKKETKIAPEHVLSLHLFLILMCYSLSIFTKSLNFFPLTSKKNW